MSVYLAFYKGRSEEAGLRGWINRVADAVVRWVTGSRYSHCEIAYWYCRDLSGRVMYCCYSASARDGGVRVKHMYLPADKWDLVEIDGRGADVVELFYRETEGAAYDWSGLFGLVLPVRHSAGKWFCSEWCASVLGLAKSHTYTPQKLAELMGAHDSSES